MSNSTTNLETIAESQANKETTANALFDAASPATYFGRHAEACSGLTWGYYGGVTTGAGSPSGVGRVANGTILLTASQTNWVEHDTTTGVVSTNTSGPTGGTKQLDYVVVTGASSVTSYSDLRLGGGGSGGGAPSGAAGGDLSGTYPNPTIATMVGDSGAGGVKGLVPAPAAGDAAALKFLGAGGTWGVPSGSGAPSTSQYVTLALDSGLSAERVLTAGSGVTFTDGGANGNLTIDVTGASGGIGATSVTLPLGRRITAMYQGGSATGTAAFPFGFSNATIVIGSADGAGITRNDAYLQCNWGGIKTNASAANNNGMYASTVAAHHAVWMSNVANCGGFYMKARLGTNSTMGATQSVFQGLRNDVTNPAGGTAPSAFVNCIGVGWDSGDANLQVMCNDGSGTCTKTDLGSNFALATSQIYEYEFYAAPGSTTITWAVSKINTAFSSTSSFSSNTPAVHTDLFWVIYTSNNATAAFCTSHFGGYWVEALA